jgi:hypothetical protein
MMSGGREGRGGWGQKVLSRPSADSFAVGRRQKEKEREVVRVLEKVLLHPGCKCIGRKNVDERSIKDGE